MLLRQSGPNIVAHTGHFETVKKYQCIKGFYPLNFTPLIRMKGRFTLNNPMSPDMYLASCGRS